MTVGTQDHAILDRVPKLRIVPMKIAASFIPSARLTRTVRRNLIEKLPPSASVEVVKAASTVLRDMGIAQQIPSFTASWSPDDANKVVASMNRASRTIRRGRRDGRKIRHYDWPPFRRFSPNVQNCTRHLRPSDARPGRHPVWEALCRKEPGCLVPGVPALTMDRPPDGVIRRPVSDSSPVLS